MPDLLKIHTGVQNFDAFLEGGLASGTISVVDSDPMDAASLCADNAWEIMNTGK